MVFSFYLERMPKIIRIGLSNSLQIPHPALAAPPCCAPPSYCDKIVIGSRKRALSSPYSSLLRLGRKCYAQGALAGKRRLEERSEKISFPFLLLIFQTIISKR